MGLTAMNGRPINDLTIGCCAIQSQQAQVCAHMQGNNLEYRLKPLCLITEEAG